MHQSQPGAVGAATTRQGVAALLIKLLQCRMHISISHPQHSGCLSRPTCSTPGPHLTPNALRPLKCAPKYYISNIVPWAPYLTSKAFRPLKHTRKTSTLGPYTARPCCDRAQKDAERDALEE